ncbi:hypothetical protein BDV12DRAFT_180454 [Aspergillus spectabilis]
MAAESGAGRFSKLLSISRQLPWRRRINLDSRTFLMMLKGALPPTIVIAIHQSDAIADITLTTGYLSALISVLSQALMPRAKFMKIMLFDLLATCVSASLCCLAVFCAVKAREHNTPIDASESVKNGYSSDACVVSAIWLVVLIWAANAVRAWRPMELQDPMVAFSIFASVTVTRAGTFVTLSEGLDFISRLLKGFMIGFAVAIGVSLFIYPATSRGHVFQDIRSYVQRIDGILQAQLDFLQGSPEAWTRDRESSSRDPTLHSTLGDANHPKPDVESKKKRLQAAMTDLNALHGKLQADLFYSKDEIAWGELSAMDLSRIGGLLRNLLLPLSGMAMLPDILDMVVKQEEPQVVDDDTLTESKERALEQSEIEQVVDMLHSRLTECAGLVRAGLEYALLKMELVESKELQRQRKHTRDEESGDLGLDPCQADLTSQFEQKLHAYHSQRNLPQALASIEGFLPEKTSEAAPDEQVAVANGSDIRREWFTILYILQLQDNLLKATLDLIGFANGKVIDGTMKRHRMILTIHNSITAWLSFTPGEPGKDRSQVDPASLYGNIEPDKYPDPEHLPPSNIWEKSSTCFRLASRLIKSEESMFGFRVAAASFCVGILAYLHQTQDFFIRQRCIWAMIVIVIGMSPTSGQTLLGFLTRIAATVVSLALSLMVWYVPDQKTAGVVVFLYLANVFEYYFYLTKPQLFGPSVIAIVTLNVIVGYELQIRKLGLEVGTSNGQPYYPIYLFGPYKLAAVAAGCAISFFWVILPYPVTSKSTLRRNLGRGLFILAKFYSCMHTTIKLRLSGGLGSVQDAHSTSYKLARIRRKIFKEEMTLLNNLRMLSHFSTFEPPIGGKFPKDTYDNIISEVHRILISMALMAHTAQNLETPAAARQSSNDTKNNTNKWVSRLASIALQSEDFNSHSITSLLCHLSSSITNAQPLPPYLSAGGSFPLARRLQQVDRELLSMRHVGDPALWAFATMEVLRSVVGISLSGLMRNVRDLVGEISFDFHVRTAPDDVELRGLMDDQDD